MSTCVAPLRADMPVSQPDVGVTDVGANTSVRAPPASVSKDVLAIAGFFCPLLAAVALPPPICPAEADAVSVALVCCGCTAAPIDPRVVALALLPNWGCDCGCGCTGAGLGGRVRWRCGGTSCGAWAASSHADTSEVVPTPPITTPSSTQRERADNSATGISGVAGGGDDNCIKEDAADKPTSCELLRCACDGAVEEADDELPASTNVIK